MRETMALLDEWRAPEPTPYFDVRLKARLREVEAGTARWGWMQWMRKPALAVSFAILMVVGISVLQKGDRGTATQPMAAAVEPGTAVGDLEMLDKNHDLYADFDLLDDLQVQQDVTANP